MSKRKNITLVGLPGLARQVNLQVVTRQMRRMELFAKVDLARKLGISTTTMTKLFAQLESDQIIVRSPVEDKTFGRPRILYQLSHTLQIAAVVIDVDSTTIGFSGFQGSITEQQQVSFPTGNDPKELFNRIQREFSKLQQQLNAPCRLIGICSPGLIEKQTDRIMACPNLHWMEGTNPAKTISELLNIPAFVMHEEKALGRAQLRYLDDAANYITMDFSAGVGMSVVVDGRHLSGSNGYAAEIGHVIMQPGGKLCGCGNHGCLETIASDRVFQSEMNMPMDRALEELKNGQKQPVEIARKVIEAQARGIAATINIFNPERLFVYSCLSEAVPDYIETVRREVGRQALDLSFKSCTIEITRHGKLTGALLLTIDQLIENSTIAANGNSV